MPSDRLLRGMQKVCSHDLPNQIVVLQSLLQMLQLEESDRLSPDGQEYVRRLQKVTQRTVELARFLKEMHRLSSYVSKPEELSLQVLAREIQGALKQHFPDKQFLFDWQWDVLTIVGDYRTMLQALIEILTSAAAQQERVCQVTGASAAHEKKLAIHFGLASAEPSPDNTSPSLPRPDVQPAADQRMEIILAREWLAVSHATLEWLPTQPPGESRFTIHVPNR